MSMLLLRGIQPHELLINTSICQSLIPGYHQGNLSRAGFKRPKTLPGKSAENNHNVSLYEIISSYIFTDSQLFAISSSYRNKLLYEHMLCLKACGEAKELSEGQRTTEGHRSLAGDVPGRSGSPACTVLQTNAISSQDGLQKRFVRLRKEKYYVNSFPLFMK